MPAARIQPNPFTASFGAPTDLTFVGRQSEIAEARQGLADLPGSMLRSIMIAGPRGVGKTALLSAMVDDARAHGWVTASVTAGPGVGERVLDKAALSAEHLLEPDRRRALTGISIAGFSLQSQALHQDTPSWWRRISTLLDALENNGTGLLLAVDEVHKSVEDLRPLFGQYQELVNEGRNIAILMAGLPDAVDGVLSDYSLTFVQRAKRQLLGAIDLELVREAYEYVFTTSGKRLAPGVAELAAGLSEGYPYMYQLLGYHMWRFAGESQTVTSEHARRALAPTRRLAGQNLFGLELASLTNRERDFLIAAAHSDGPSSIKSIAERADMSPDNAYFYRSRVIARGLVRPAGRGSVDLISGYLRDYLREELAPKPPAGSAH